jgi:hypothetical protein
VERPVDCHAKSPKYHVRKFIIICVAFGVVCAVFQKRGQKFIKSMGYAQRDNDPNSSTRRLAAKRRTGIEKDETRKRVTNERNDADFNRRLKALGVLPAVSPGKIAVYVFNDSARAITFSIVYPDGKLTGTPDMVVAPGGYENTEIAFGGVVYIWAKGTVRRWQLNMERVFQRGDYAGCVFAD